MDYKEYNSRLKGIGAQQKKAFNFARRFPGWQSFDNTTRKVIESLAGRGLVQVNQFDQFRMHPDIPRDMFMSRLVEYAKGESSWPGKPEHVEDPGGTSILVPEYSRPAIRVIADSRPLCGNCIAETGREIAKVECSKH